MKLPTKSKLEYIVNLVFVKIGTLLTVLAILLATFGICIWLVQWILEMLCM